MQGLSWVRALRLSEKTAYLGRGSALRIEIASSSACTSAENTDDDDEGPFPPEPENTEASCGRAAERAVAPHTAAAPTPAMVLEPSVYI